jgi:hypothetical protein
VVPRSLPLPSWALPSHRLLPWAEPLWVLVPVLSWGQRLEHMPPQPAQRLLLLRREEIHGGSICVSFFPPLFDWKSIFWAVMFIIVLECAPPFDTNHAVRFDKAKCNPRSIF